MKTTSAVLLSAGLLAAVVAVGVAGTQHSVPKAVQFPVVAPPDPLDAARIESLTGLKGSMNEKEGVFKVSYPRSDLNVVADGVKITPPMGLTCWVAFKDVGPAANTMCMGDTVLTEEQVNPVMSVALENGLEVTALHNHLFWDNPKVYFMHIGGMGDQEKLAAAVGKVYAKVKETAAADYKPRSATAVIDPANTTLDPKKIDAIFNTKGDFAKGVYKATFGKTTMMGGTMEKPKAVEMPHKMDGDEIVAGSMGPGGFEMGNAMGVNTWAAFVGSDDHAAVMGDFAMYESELQTVLKTLRKNNINVVAIHNHMAGEAPRVVFLHYWAIGKTEDLAKAIKAALDTQK